MVSACFTKGGVALVLVNLKRGHALCPFQLQWKRCGYCICFSERGVHFVCVWFKEGGIALTSVSPNEGGVAIVI